MLGYFNQSVKYQDYFEILCVKITDSPVKIVHYFIGLVSK